MTTAEEDGGGMCGGSVVGCGRYGDGSGSAVCADRWYLWSLGYYLPTLALASSQPSACRDQAINGMVQCKAIGYWVKLNKLLGKTQWQ